MRFKSLNFLHLHRETVSEYVKKFNEGGIEGLLHRKYAPGRRAYLVTRRRTRKSAK